MPRSEARVFTSIWKDPAFRALSRDAQHLYLFLLTQSDLNMAGVIPLRPRRWARDIPEASAADIEKGIAELCAQPVAEGSGEPLGGPFLIVDEDTGELFVRSFIRRDQLWRQQNLLRSARKAQREVESETIRAALLAELRRLPGDEATDKAREELEGFLGELGGSLPPPPAAPPATRPPQTADESPPKGPREGPREGPVDPSLDPSAEGCEKGSPQDPATPVLLSSFTPNSPLPPPARAGASARPDLAVAALVAEVREIRPAWSEAAIRRALDDETVRHRPWPLTAQALLALARDETTASPGRLPIGGPWWDQPAPAREPTPHCGQCSPARRIEDGEGRDRGPCPRCHPSAQTREATP